jgi:hypothetical protein
MAVTAAQLKNLILAKIGDHENTTPVAQNIDVLWDLYAYKVAYPNGYRLQYLYTLKEAIAMMRGVSFVNGFVESGVRNDELSDENTVLNAILKDTNEEIAKIETQASALRAPQLGTLTRTSPIMPGDAPYPATAFAPDPNSRPLRGDPVVVPPNPQRN